MNVEWMHVNDLRPYHRNPRKHKKAVEALEDSIRQYGFKVPIVADEESEIVAGHARYKAVVNLKNELDDRIEQLEEEGRDELAQNLSNINDGLIPVIEETELTNKELQEFRIVDNKLTEMSGWDIEKLKIEMEEITGDVIGFEDENINDMLAKELGEGTDDDDDTDETDSETGEEDISEDPEDQEIEFMCPYCKEPFVMTFGEFLEEVESNED